MLEVEEVRVLEVEEVLVLEVEVEEVRGRHRVNRALANALQWYPDTPSYLCLVNIDVWDESGESVELGNVIG